jgi:AraC-like DNA-binding protein
MLWLGLPLIALERGSSELLIILPSNPRGESRHLTELFLASLFLDTRRMLGQRLHLEEVRLRHSAAAPRAEYERVFAGPVRFDRTEDALCFPGAVSDYRRPASGPSTAAFIERAAREQALLPGRLSFREKACLAIGSALLSRLSCEQQPIAYDLGVSSATMRQRLRAEHADFAEAKASVQRELAAQLLTVPVLDLDEVAARCGFSDVSAFRATFTRWTGLAPAAYRREVDRDSHRAGEPVRPPARARRRTAACACRRRRRPSSSPEWPGRCSPRRATVRGR